MCIYVNSYIGEYVWHTLLQNPADPPLSSIQANVDF